MTPTGSSAPWSIGANTLESSVQQTGRVELFQGTDTRRARPIWVHVFDAGTDEDDPTSGAPEADAVALAESPIDPETAAVSGVAAAAADFVARARAFGEIDERALIRLNSTGTTPVGDPYVITDAADRGTLARRIGVGSGATDTDLSRVAGVIGRGLAAMHRRGLVHETLSPEKVLLVTGPSQERVGSGTLWDDEFVRLDIPGEVRAVQSPVDRFASPEQLRGDGSTAATDIYRLSGVMAEMAAGRERRSGERWVDLLDEVSADGRPALAAVLSRGLSADAEHRPLSAEAWTDDVMSALGGTDSGIGGVATPGRGDIALRGGRASDSAAAARGGWGSKLMKGAAAVLVLGGLAVAATALLNRDGDVATDPVIEPTSTDELADDAADGVSALDGDSDRADSGAPTDGERDDEGTIGDGADGEVRADDESDSPAPSDDAPDTPDPSASDQDGTAGDDGSAAGDGSADDDADATTGDEAGSDSSNASDNGAENSNDGADTAPDDPDDDGPDDAEGVGSDSSDADGASGADAGDDDRDAGEAPTGESAGSGATSGSPDSNGSSQGSSGNAAAHQVGSVDKPEWEGPMYCPPATGGPVSGLQVVQITDQTISIEWSPVDEYLNIYVNDRFHDTVIPHADLYVVEGLSPMSPYNLSVSMGTDKYAGSMVCAQTVSFGSGAMVAGVSLPTGFRVLQASASTITVSWDASEATGYSMHLGSSKVATVGAGTTSFTFSGLAMNRVYTLGIRAIDGNNRSDILKIDGATTAAPGGPVSGAPIEAPAG